MQGTAAHVEVGGKYTIVGRLGVGAGGETFEAIDIRNGARVALKRLGLSTTRDWKAVQLFEREAKVLSMLEHPAIPTLHDSFVVESADGPVSYLAHDFAPGQSLRGWIEAGWRPTETEVIRIGVFLLDVLAYLHALSPAVIHRDIKPANVIRAEDGRLWLVDFGSVRDATTTMSGGSTVAGTYGYMAPEQFRGHAVPESDVYGVGGTLLYLLSRRSPTDFPQANLKVDFRGQVRASKKLGEWLERALEPAPEERFPSALVAMAGLRGGRTAPSARTRSSRTRVIVLLSVLGAVVAGSAGVIVHDVRKSHATMEAQVAAAPPATLPPRPSSMFKTVRGGRLLEIAHNAPIFSMAGSTDRRKFATGSSGSAKVWDFERGKVEVVLAGHEGEVRGIAFTKDDKRIVTAGGRSIRIWDASTGAQLAMLLLAGVTDVEITPDDKSIVASAADGMVRVYDLGTQALVRSFSHGVSVNTLTLTPDGRQVATGGSDGSVKVWNVADGSALGGWSAHKDAVYAIAFSPDGQSIATAGGDHMVRLSPAQNGQRRSEGVSWSHDDLAFGVTFSNDGNLVYSTGREGKIQVADAHDGHLVSVSHNRSESKAHPIFSKDGSILLVANGPAVMRLSVARRGLGTKVPEPVVGEPAVEARPRDRDHELYLEAVRSLAKWPTVPLEEGEVKVKEALAANPASPLAWIANTHLAIKRAFVRNDEYDGPGLALARAHLEHAATLGPRAAEWWRTELWLCRAEKKPQAAREAARQYRAIAPGEPGLVLAEATLDVDEEQYEKAIAALTRLVTSNRPARWLPDAYSILLRAYGELGDVDAAMVAHRRLVAADPKNPWLHGDFGDFLLRDAGDVKGALEETRAALALMSYGVARGTLADALTERGEATLWGYGSTADAIRDFSEAIDARPDAAAAYYGRAAAYRKNAILDGDPRVVKNARDDLAKVVSLKPKWVEAKRAEAELGAVEALARKKKN